MNHKLNFSDMVISRIFSLPLSLCGCKKYFSKLWALIKMGYRRQSALLFKCKKIRYIVFGWIIQIRCMGSGSFYTLNHQIYQPTSCKRMAYHGLKGLEVGVLKRALFAAQSFETYPDGSECYPFVPSWGRLFEKKTFVSLYNIWRRSKLSTDLLSLELFLSIAKREGLYMSVLFLFVIQWALNSGFFLWQRMLEFLSTAQT